MSTPGKAREDRSLAASAAACAALVFIVVASSAWLRLAAAPCPAAGCEGFGLADAVRLAHRVAAMGVTVLALVIAAVTWKAPARPGRRVAATVLLVLLAALAIIGRRSGSAAPPAVLVANLLGGLALLGLSVGVAVAARAPRGQPAMPFVAASTLFAFATAAGGVLAAAPPADASSLALVHRALSWVTLAGWGLLAMSASPAPGVRLATRLAAVLIAAQVVAALAFPAGPLARWAHNLLAATALCAAIAATLASRSASRPDPAIAERASAGP